MGGKVRGGVGQGKGNEDQSLCVHGGGKVEG